MNTYNVRVPAGEVAAIASEVLAENIALGITVNYGR